MLAGTVLLLLLTTPAAAQSARLKNIQLCNGADRTSFEPQIKGCTALIAAGNETARIVAVAYNNRGNAYVRRGDFERAIQDYDQALKVDTNYAKAFNNRGVAYGKTGQHDLAIRDLDEAIRLDPNYANAFANRAESHLNKGEHDRAIQDYGEAIRLQPTSAVWNGRCRARAAKGELETALADCSEALRLDANSAAAFDLRGLVYLRMGQWDLAISNYNSALGINPGLASSLYGRGLAQARNGTGRSGQGRYSCGKISRAKYFGRICAVWTEVKLGRTFVAPIAETVVSPATSETRICACLQPGVCIHGCGFSATAYRPAVTR